jgi:hypothetical protein
MLEIEGGTLGDERFKSLASKFEEGGLRVGGEGSTVADSC